MESSCFGANCKELKSQTFTEANKCAIPKTVSEQVDGCKSTVLLASLQIVYLTLQSRDYISSWSKYANGVEAQALGSTHPN